MSKLFSASLAVVLGALLWLSSLGTMANPALAGDVTHGKAIFTANCAACHTGGLNAINPSKTLKMADLQANGKDSVEAIAAQVINGNGAMPGFKGRLSDDDIADVAAYVLAQAENGWQ